MFDYRDFALELVEDCGAGCADAVVVGSALVDLVANDLSSGGSHTSAISGAHSLISSIRNGVNLATSN